MQSDVITRGGSSDHLIRGLDLAACVVAIVCTLPLLALLALLVKAEDGGPVVFAQWRVGWDGRLFRCMKFRTMSVDADARLRHLLATDPAALAEWTADQKLRADPRVTRIGAFLRRSSLDELPQLLNVLAGQMSLVGPRPIVPGEAPRYGARFWTYCRVRPGLTGIWQISGRNDVRYRRRVAMDVMFARRLTPLLYLSVLARTPAALLLRRGAY